MLTEVANILSDAMVMGERSGLSTAAAEYESQGLDRQSAWFRATLDSLGQIGWAGAGGFLSGVGMAGGKVALQQGSTAIYDGLTHQRQGTAQDAQIDVEGARTDAQTGADTPAAENPVEGAKSAPVEGAGKLPRMTMADFTDTESPVWRNVAVEDAETKSQITQEVHRQMVDEGRVVTIPEDTTRQVAQSYPDVRTKPRAEKNAILKPKVDALKKSLRQFLKGLMGTSFEFEVNGNVLEATLYGTGIREVMEKVTQEKASMLYHSAEIFKGAQYLYSSPDSDGDPNIYRWNYFYTPVQIGDEVVGVRIAVRDVTKGQNMTPESQIYNWGIKRGTSLDGGSPGQSPLSSGVSSDVPGSMPLDGEGLGPKVASPGVSSSVASVDSIPQTPGGVNPESGDGMPNSVGAAAAGFTGDRERGFSHNLATDAARHEDVQHEYQVNPQMYHTLANAETLQRATDIFNQGVDVAHSTVERAIGAAQAGQKLDCYGAGLTRVYSYSGFVPVARVTFNSEFANPGWTEQNGTPDIYVMMATDFDADTVRSKQNSYKVWSKEELDQLPLMEYDEAMAYRDALLARRFAQNAPAASRITSRTGVDTSATENPVEGAKNAPVEGAVVKADTSVLDGHILRDLNLARASFIEFARQHFPSSVKNTETGREIGISRRGLDKFLSGRIPYEKYASGFHIPELIERAHLVTNADNTHLEQAESIPTYDYYDNPIEIDGKNYMAHIRVRNTMMWDKYYGHTISEIDDIKIEPSARTSVPGETPAVQLVNAIDGSINNIPQPGQEVNPEAGDGMPNSVGAAAARFEYQEAPTQAVSDRLFTDMQRRDVPDLRTEPHKVYTEAEANADARERLAFDYDGEKAAPETMVYLPVGNVTQAFGSEI